MIPLLRLKWVKVITSLKLLKATFVVMATKTTMRLKSENDSYFFFFFFSFKCWLEMRLSQLETRKWTALSKKHPPEPPSPNLLVYLTAPLLRFIPATTTRWHLSLTRNYTVYRISGRLLFRPIVSLFLRGHLKTHYESFQMLNVIKLQVVTLHRLFEERRSVQKQFSSLYRYRFYRTESEETSNFSLT